MFRVKLRWGHAITLQAQVSKTYHPTLRETCLLTFASYVAPASEAGIYNVRHVYKLTATNTTVITGGGIRLHNNTMDKCCFLNTRSMKHLIENISLNAYIVFPYVESWKYHNYKYYAFWGWNQQSGARKNTWSPPFFPTHLNKASSLVKKRIIALTYLKIRSWRIIQFALFKGTGGSSSCRRHSHRSWLVITLEGVYFSNVQSKTSEILPKNVENAKQINVRMKTGRRRRN